MTKKISIYIFILLALIFISLKIYGHYAFLTNDYDTGIYSNLAWNIANGNGFYSAVLEKNHLGEHFSPIMLIPAAIYKFYPNVNVLMFLQGLAVAFSFLILTILSQIIFKDLSEKTNLIILSCLTILFLFYRPVMSALWFQFHPSTLGMPLAAACLYFLHKGKRIPLYICAALLLTTKESAILTITALAIYSLLVLKNKKDALILSIISAAAAILIFLVIMPVARAGEEWGHYSRFNPFTDPAGKMKYIFLILAPLLFLPLFSWRAFLPAALFLILNISVSLNLQYSLKYHYDDQGIIFIIAAAMHGLKNIIAAWKKSVPAMKGSQKFFIISLWLLILFFIHGKSPYDEFKKCRKQDFAHELHSALNKYTNLPEDKRILTQTGLGPHLSNRKNYISLKENYRQIQYKTGDIVILSDKAGDFKLNLNEGLEFYHNSHDFKCVDNTKFLTVFEYSID